MTGSIDHSRRRRQPPVRTPARPSDARPSLASRPRRVPPRVVSLFMALAAITAALLAVTLDVRTVPGARAAVSPWHRSIEGLYGDNGAGVVFVGDTRRGGFRFYTLFDHEFGLFRAGSQVDEWTPLVPNTARPETTVVRSLALGRDDIERQKLFAGLQSRPLLARSLDGGVSWSTRDGPPGITRVDLLDTTTTGRVYAAQVGTTMLSTSDDLGDTWTQVSPVIGAQDQVSNLFAAPDRPQVFMQTGDRLYSSDNVPDTWRLALGPASATTKTLAVSMATAAVGRRVYAVGKSAGAWSMVYSLDSGVIWTPASWPAEPNAEPTALGAGEAGFGTPVTWLGFDDGRIFRSTDIGKTWSLITTAPIAPISISVDPHNYETWVGTDGLGLLRIGTGGNPSISTTGAVPAQALSVVAPSWDTEHRAVALTRITPIRLERTGGGQPTLTAIFDSFDKGQTWLRRFMTATFGSALLPSTNYGRDKRLYSDRWVSRNGGISWSDLGQPPGGGQAHVVAVGPVSGTYSLLLGVRQPWNGTSGGTGLLYSDTGGASWQALDAGSGDIVDALFSPTFPQDLTAYFITQRGVIFRTLDGQTFESISTVRLLAGQGIVHDLVISPQFDLDRSVFVAVEDTADAQRAKVFASTNGGETWEDRFSDLPPRGRPRVLGLSPNFRSDRTMFLGLGREPGDADEVPTVFGSDTGGTEWLGQLSLGRLAVTDFAFGGTKPTGVLFAAAGRSGVWVRDLDGSPIVDLIPTPTPTRTPSPIATQTPTNTPPPGSGTPGDLETVCLDADADAYVSQSSPDATTGVGKTLQLYHDDGEQTAVYIKFDVSTIPASSQLQSATVELYLSGLQPSTTPPISEISFVGREWIENRVTWSNRPPGVGKVDAPVMDATLGFKRWDVLPRVQDWLAGRSRNDGFVIETANVLPGQPMRANFVSREGNTAAQRPRLCVTYRSPTGTPTRTPTGTRTVLATETATPTDETPTASPTAAPTTDGSPSPTADGTAAVDTPSPTPTPTDPIIDPGTSTATATRSDIGGEGGTIYLPFGYRYVRSTSRRQSAAPARPAAERRAARPERRP
ncbi:MAG: DNRLRE domain-containing protein [Ardenticatenales bacterium]